MRSVHVASELIPYIASELISLYFSICCMYMMYSAIYGVNLLSLSRSLSLHSTESELPNMANNFATNTVNTFTIIIFLPFFSMFRGCLI